VSVVWSGRGLYDGRVSRPEKYYGVYVPLSVKVCGGIGINYHTHTVMFTQDLMSRLHTISVTCGVVAAGLSFASLFIHCSSHMHSQLLCQCSWGCGARTLKYPG